MITIKYFASLREQLNCTEEQLPAQQASTLSALKQRLMKRSDLWQQTLSNPAILVAVDQQLMHTDTTLNDGAEIAFFPPMTGG